MTLDWTETKDRITKRVGEIHVQLEQVGLGMEETNALRGEIRALRNFVEGVEPGTVIQPVPSISYT